jgi:hypothetical protein
MAQAWVSKSLSPPKLSLSHGFQAESSCHITSQVCDPWSAKFTSVDGEPMFWWAKNFSPCYPFYLPLFYSIIRPRNQGRQILWCHGSPRVSKPSPDTILSFVAILTTTGTSGSLPDHLLWLFYSLFMHILQGESLDIQVSNNLSPFSLCHFTPFLPSCSTIPCHTQIIFINI